VQIKLRPYQKIAINAAIKALQRVGKALVVLATALGKTLVAALVAKKIGGKGIFLVHNNDILEDAMKEFRKVFPHATFGLYNGQTKDIVGADIVFASLQTMTRNLKKFKRNQFKWMVVDESHHSHADTYRKVIEFFFCKKLGITATPNRSDLQDIRQFFGQEVIDIQLEEAIARGWLPRIEYHVISDESLDEAKLEQIAQEVAKGKKRLTIAEINRRVFIRARDEKIAEIVSGYPEKAAVFCRSVTHTETFAKSLSSSRTYHSSNSRAKNDDALEALRNGLIRRILAVNAFNEGINVPDVGLVVFARATDSETIFRQQLGRGLRPGKDKLIVLDFVGNVDRMRLIRQMTEKIATLHEKYTTDLERNREGYRRDALMLSGKGFEFTFSRQVVDLFEVLDRVDVEPYKTWEQASKAAIRAGFKSSTEYTRGYRKEDPRLPGRPDFSYQKTGWPGWDVFLGIPIKYSTWQEASKAAVKLGITGFTSYKKKYKRDPKLPSAPKDYYKDFPGIAVFLGKERYPTWMEAAEAAKKFGLSSEIEYKKGYRKDPRLPQSPYHYYRGEFPGWVKFLDRKIIEKYPTWQEASVAVKKLKIKTTAEYTKKKKYMADPRLPASPWTEYADFPGMSVFLGNPTKYPTWQEASKAAKKLKATNWAEYHARYKTDPRLPIWPNVTYSDFPGLQVFLGLKK
jgi:superfamily II DNA or RNA helicase